MTRAGLDPSRIEERAAMLAKLQGQAPAHKRKRGDDDDDVEMEGADSDADGADAEGWMDVDGEEAPKKRIKGNSGAVTAVDRRAPKTDRRFAGMRNEEVRAVICSHFKRVVLICFSLRFLAGEPGCQAAQSWPETSQHARQGWRGRSCYQNKNGMWASIRIRLLVSESHNTLQPKHLFAGKRKGGKTQRR